MVVDVEPRPPSYHPPRGMNASRYRSLRGWVAWVAPRSLLRDTTHHPLPRSRPNVLDSHTEKKSPVSRLDPSQLGENSSNLLQLDRLSQEEIHPASKRLFLSRNVAQTRDSNNSSPRAAARIFEAADGADGAEAVEDWHVDVHEDDVRLGGGQLEVWVRVATIRSGLLVRGAFVGLDSLLAVLRFAVGMSGLFSENFEEAEIESLLGRVAVS